MKTSAVDRAEFVSAFTIARTASSWYTKSWQRIADDDPGCRPCNGLIERASVACKFNSVTQLPEKRISCLGHGIKWVFVDTLYPRQRCVKLRVTPPNAQI